MKRSHQRALLLTMLAVGVLPSLALLLATVAVQRLARRADEAQIVVPAVGLLLVLAAAAFAWRAAAAVAHPIGKLSESAALMRGPNPGHRAPETGADDLAEIARSLNALADRADATERRSADQLALVSNELAIEKEILASVLYQLDDGAATEPWRPAGRVLPSLDATLDSLTFAVVDLETTGLNPGAGDRVVSMASVRVTAGQVNRGDCFTTLVNPERPIPPAAARIHGIDDTMISAAPRLPDALRRLVEHVGESVVVGHVVAFDLAFLEPQARALRLPALGRHGALDTLLLGHALLPASRATTLEDLATLLGVQVVDRHTALGDATTTAECFVRLLRLLEQRGIRRLGDVLALQTPSALRRALASALTSL